MPNQNRRSATPLTLLRQRLYTRFRSIINRVARRTRDPLFTPSVNDHTVIFLHRHDGCESSDAVEDAEEGSGEMGGPGGDYVGWAPG